MVRWCVEGPDVVGRLLVCVELVRQDVVRKQLGWPVLVGPVLVGADVVGTDVDLGRMVHRAMGGLERSVGAFGRGLGRDSLGRLIGAASMSELLKKDEVPGRLAQVTQGSLGSRLPLLGTAGHLWFFASGLAAISAGFVALCRNSGPSIPGPHLAWWSLVAAFAISEGFVVHLRVGRHAHSFSLSELPLVVSLAFARPSTIVIAQAVGVGLTLALYRRQTPIRVIFNLAQRAFTTMIAIAVFRMMLAVGGPTWPVIWAAGVAAVLLADVAAAALINVAIAVDEKRPARFDELIGVPTVLAFANAALGLTAAMMVANYPPV